MTIALVGPSIEEVSMEIICGSNGDCYLTLWGIPVFVLFVLVCAGLMFIISKVWPEE